MAKKDIIVIGSKGHKHADCYDWNDVIPYLGDYYYIVLNLTSLTQKILESFSLSSNDKLNKMRREINEIIWKDTEVFCITEKICYAQDFGVTINNYDWCPVDLNIKAENGEKFNKEIKEGYLSYVKNWSHFLDKIPVNIDGNRYQYQQEGAGFVLCEEMLCNRAGKPIAFLLEFVEIGDNSGDKTSKGISFYPPTTKIDVSQGIDCLINEKILKVKTQEISLPTWIEKVQLEKEIQIREKKEECELRLAEELKDLEAYKKELNVLTRFKGLLTEDGDVLVTLVDEAFALFGIQLEPVEGYKEDRVFRHQEDEIPIEIKGLKGSIPLKGGLQQLISRLNKDAPKNFKAEGVFIGNHYKETPLNENLEGRNVPFEPNVIEEAKDWHCSLISTLEIFKFVNRKLSGEDVDNEFRDRVFNTIGVEQD
jgi:hypothetical protein